MVSGSIRAIILGIAATVVLMTVLAASRLFKQEEPKRDIEVVEISAAIPAPEEPPLEDLEDEQTEPEDVELVDPAPVLELLDSPAVEAPELLASSVKLEHTMSVDLMSIDRAPANLPVRKVVRVIAKPKYKPRPISKPSKVTSKPAYNPKVKTASKPKYKPKPKYVPKPKPKYKPKPKPKYKPPVLKAYYGPSELDSSPRETRKGRFTWPRSAKAKSGTVKLLIEIGTSGKVSVLSVLSSTDSALSSAAQKLAKSSRYTAPKKNGKPVKARFTKTYKLIKPR